MVRERKLGRFRGQVIYQGRGRCQGRGRGYFNKSSYTRTSKLNTQLSRKRKKKGYGVESSFKYLEEYGTEGERHTRIMSLQTGSNTKDTDKIGMYMKYKAEITNYIKRSK